MPAVRSTNKNANVPKPSTRATTGVGGAPNANTKRTARAGRDDGTGMEQRGYRQGKTNPTVTNVSANRLRRGGKVGGQGGQGGLRGKAKGR